MKFAISLLFLGLALTACSGQAGPVAATPAATASPVATATPTVEPSAAPTPAATTAELDAMARRIFPGDHPAGCGDLALCPITDRLRARVEELGRPLPGQPGPVIQFCGCQNGADGMRVTSEVTASGGIAHVVLLYGASNGNALDLIFVRQSDGRLLLDDRQHTGGGPATSIYAPSYTGR